MADAPRTTLPNPRANPRFGGGACTFCRYPRLEDVPKEQQPVDWALYGVPFDSGVTYRPGTRFGPRAIRDESQYVKPYHIEHDLMLTDILSLADAGDSPVANFSCEQNAQVVTEFAMGVGDPAHTKLMAVGGDHSIAYANMKATFERRGRPEGGLALLHFDSHVDTVDVTMGEKWSHASPFIRAVEDGILNPKKMLSIGIKGPLNTPDDLNYAKEHGVTIVTREQLARDGDEVIGKFAGDLAQAPCYLTFDIDVFDPSVAPGTGTPSVGGLLPHEGLSLLRRFAKAFAGGPPNIIGADVVEVLPDRDPTGCTALLAAHVMFEILCLDALGRR